MEACIVIAKIIGILNSQPIDVYQLDCGTAHSVIIQNQEFKEVEILSINSNDFTYNIKIKN